MLRGLFSTGDSVSLVVSSATKISTMSRNGSNIKDIKLVDAMAVEAELATQTVFYINNTDNQVSLSLPSARSFLSHQKENYFLSKSA